MRGLSPQKQPLLPGIGHSYRSGRIGSTFEARRAGSTENLAPSVTLSAPGSGDTFPVSTFVSLEATASDTEGSVQRVDFYANDVPVATSTTGIADRYAATWFPDQAGSYTITAVATDDRGATRSSIPVVITVTPLRSSARQSPKHWR